MKTAHKSKPAQRSAPAEAPKPVEPKPADEFAEALLGMVTAAEKDGGRDKPEVVAARELLARHGKPA